MNKTFGFLFFIIFLIGLTHAKIKCYKCDQTKENSDCLLKLDKIEVVECDEGITQCFTKIDEAGLIHRGCLPKDEKCEKDSKVCKECTPEGDKYCNNKDFPEDRIKCYHCEDCLKIEPDKDKDKLSVCLVHKDDNECYTDKMLGSRGCSIDSKACAKDEGDGKCKWCTEKEGCNKEEITATCYKCDSTDTKDCIRPKDNTEVSCSVSRAIKTCAKAADVECYTFEKLGKIVRGCDDDKSEYSKTENKCKTHNCNIKCTKVIKECLQCDSSNEKCKNNEGIEGKECPFYTTSCYRCEDDKGTNRGCGIADESKGTCSYCNDKENCLPKQLCYVCNSKEDKNCANGGKNLKSQECKDAADTECGVYLDDDNNTVRSCSKDIEKCEKEKCLKCSGQNCNHEMFPKNRLLCYQCASTEKDCTPEQTTVEKAIACPKYKSDDKCFMASEDGKKITRGCISNGNEICDKSKEKCAQCDQNACNRLPISGVPSFSCIQCDATDEKCKWGFEEKDAVNCTNIIEFWKKPECYILNKDDKISRGCLTTDMTCDDPKTCKKCDINACNLESYADFTCIRCRSDMPGQNTCGTTNEGMQPGKCHNPVTHEKRGCYIDKFRNIVIRGCLVDLTPNDYKNCIDEKYTNCISCTKDANCNTDKMKGSSTTVKAMSFISIGIISIIINIIN